MGSNKIRIIMILLIIHIEFEKCTAYVQGLSTSPGDERKRKLILVYYKFDLSLFSVFIVLIKIIIIITHHPN